MVVNPLEVGAGLEVQLEAWPETLKTTDPVGAAKPVTPVTFTAKVSPEPVTGEAGKLPIEIAGTIAPRLTLIVAEVAVR